MVPTDKQLANLKPWPKGVSGNPGGGAARRFAARIRKATRNGQDLIEVAYAIAMSGKSEDKDRLAAVKWLADRGFGKAPITIEIEGRVAALPVLDVDLLTDEDLMSLVRIHGLLQQRERVIDVEPGDADPDPSADDPGAEGSGDASA